MRPPHVECSVFSLGFQRKDSAEFCPNRAGCNRCSEVTVSHADAIARTTTRKRKTMKATNGDDLDVGHDLEITKVTRRASGGGTWVCGTMSGHRFDALVFPEHADCPDWEIGDSRISKLFIQRLADKQTVFNWDRG